MRHVVKSTPLDYWRLLFFVVSFFSLFLAVARAQKPSGANSPKYDSQTEMKIKATVEEVRLPPESAQRAIVHLLVKNGSDSLDVYLCPKSYLEDMGISFSNGDDIGLTGSKIKHDSADLILARDVVKGDVTLVLRDNKGNPVWSWHR